MVCDTHSHVFDYYFIRHMIRETRKRRKKNNEQTEYERKKAIRLLKHAISKDGMYVVHTIVRSLCL